MKKILSDKSFWIIMVISILSLTFLTVGVVFLTRSNAKEFYASGYILDSSNTGSPSKYYFDENTVYKENVFNQYVFKDTNNNEVKANKDNFIHYLNKSLSFMKNGVILDLDNFKENLVPYYNITDKSIIEYNNGGYYVETADKTLVFGNFLGRITDNKYIVVGNDVRVRLAGSDDFVRGDYFEIIFVENGVVKVENQEGSYQTVSDGTVIYVGDSIEINLGDKSVSYGEEVKLSLGELTIDGNENIDITPSDGKVKDDEAGEGEEGGNGNDTPEQNPGENDINGDGGEETGPTTVLKKEVSVNLISAEATINSIRARFQVIDTASAIKGNLLLTVVDASTGEVVYRKILLNVTDEQDVAISTLRSNNTYVMTIVDEDNTSGIQYFQKSFKTDSLDLKLIREMVTENSLTYSLDFGNMEDVRSADVSLVDESNQIIASYTVVSGENNRVVFDGLENNTSYDVIVNNVVIKNVLYENLYSSRTSSLTLKLKPTLGEVKVDDDDENKSFVLSMSDVLDPDKSIVSYTYQIYKAEDITEEGITTASAVYSFTREELNEELLKLDEAKNLFGNQDYRFKIVAKYYDNYRYNEIETMFSDYFQITGKPTISFEPDVIDFNRISGTITIHDEGCTVPFAGRSCFDEENNFVVRYYGGTTTTRNTIRNIVIDAEKQTLTFDLTGLTENVLYTFEVYADVDLHNDNGLQKGQYLGGFNVSTTSTSELMIQNWKNEKYSSQEPIAVSAEMVSLNPNDDSIDKLASLTFNLYSGNVKNTILSANPIASFTVTEGIKDTYYNKIFNLSSKTFGIEDINKLKELSDGKLSRYYTIEITDAFDADKANEFKITNNIYVYEVPAILLLEDELATPEIATEAITNEQTKSNLYSSYGISYDANLADDIIRGYKVSAIFDKNKIETYFRGINPIVKINFYAHDSKGRLIETKTIDFLNDERYEVYFFFENGTDYDVVDKKLTRGNTYIFSYDLGIDDDGDESTEEILFPNKKPTSDKIVVNKQSPSFKLYIQKSDKSSITYRYKVFDYDNALYMEDDKYYMHYQIDEGEDNSVEIFKTDDIREFILGGLDNGSIYDISYYRAILKDADPTLTSIGKYYFDGYYDGNSYNNQYRLEYGNFDNRLKVIITDSDLLPRVSAYLLTLSSTDEKYQTVISDLDDCDGEKCIIVDYKDISTLKGKNVTVSLDAFYDTGYVGFGQPSKLGNYFVDLGLISAKDASKAGFVYQTSGNNSMGKYFYVNDRGFTTDLSYPRGILAYELISTNNVNALWTLNTSNLVNVKEKKFAKFGDIASNNLSVITTQGGISIISRGLIVNPKVLDKVTMTTSNDNFKFTSIIPKVAASVNAYINGGSMDINVSIDESTFNDDFVATSGKYKFYVDIFEECTDDDCDSGLSLVKTVETDYENLKGVTFAGLLPNKKYYYKISADMNQGGSKVKIPLFDSNRPGYVEFLGEFNTLNKDGIFDRVTYSHASSITEDTYNKRELTVTSFLKSSVNFDLKFELYDKNGEQEFEYILDNDKIDTSDKITAKYVQDISGDDFVFGPGYHRLVITAITTDLKKELELYNDYLVDSEVEGKNFKELKNPDILLAQTANIDGSEGNYDYSITYTITIVDKDKVIKDGIYYIELQNSAYDNACGGDGKGCKVTAVINENKCSFDNNKMTGCNIRAQDKDTQVLTITFNGLKPDTNYVIYVYANTYRNNVSLTEKEGLVYVRKGQYTKSALNFSLGAVTPTAVGKNKLVITFAGAANLQDSLKGIDYDITVQGAGKVASGSLGKTDTTNNELRFGVDADLYPTITIDVPEGKQLGLNNYVIITYYYQDKDGRLQKLKIGENTSFQYTVKNEN